MKTILLVEDSRFLRLANERALTRAGYRVATACDGEEALRLACARTPDLILLDMLLPKVGGQEVLQALRRNPVTAAIPVVVLSSLSQKNETRLKKDGATAYLEKSRMDLQQNSESLIQVVREALGEPPEKNAASASETAAHP